MATAPAEVPEADMLRTAPLAAGKPPPLAESGRVCDTPDCDTILRRTNLGDTCSACQLRAEPEDDATPVAAVAAPTRHQAQILDALGLPGTAAEIIGRTELSRDVVYTALYRMTRRGIVVRSGTKGRGFNGGAGYVYRRPDA